MTERALPVTILEPAGIDPELLDHTLSLRFDLGQFDERITFTRNSSATYFGSDGLLKTAAANEPRIDYDPVTGECKGFLVEEQRTNLLTYSEQFENAAWFRAQVTITPNAIVAPDGTLTADKLVENASRSEHYIESSVSPSPGTYTFSIYAKAGERNLLWLVPVHIGADQGTTTSVSFNVGTMSVVGTIPAHATASIQNVGGGWCRCSVTITITGTITAIIHRTNVINSSGEAIYTGDGTSGIYIWGAQLEVGAFTTSYIKTEAAAATRAADSAVIAGANFSSWYRQDEGAFSVEAFSQSNAAVRFFSVNSGSTANRLDLLKASGGQVQLLTMSDGSATTSNRVTAGAFSKVAAAYKTNDIAAVLSGGIAATDLTASLPVAAQINIGGAVSGMAALNGHIKRLSYYPKRLQNAKLQALTQ